MVLSCLFNASQCIQPKRDQRNALVVYIHIKSRKNSTHDILVYLAISCDCVLFSSFRKSSVHLLLIFLNRHLLPEDNNVTDEKRKARSWDAILRFLNLTAMTSIVLDAILLLLASGVDAYCRPLGVGGWVEVFGFVLSVSEGTI